MANAISNLAVSQLKHALEIKERITALESELDEIFQLSKPNTENRP